MLPMRNGVACLGVALMVLAGTSVVPVSTGATASTPPPAFAPGSGSGQGRLVGIQLRSSGVSVGVVAGRASARFQGAQGNAESSVFDPGLLGTLATTPLVCGRPLSDVVPLDQVPPPLTASSGGGATEERTEAAGGADEPIRFGAQEASASPNSRAEARVQGMVLDIPGVMTVTGGDAHSTAELTSGQRLGAGYTRLASVSLGGGVVVLGDVEWTAEHRTGAETMGAAEFRIGSMRVAGLPVPVASAGQIQAGLDLANAVLGPIGVEIGSVDPVLTDDRAEAPPLRLTLSPTPLLLTALAPLNEAIQPLRTALLDLLSPLSLGDECNLVTVAGFSYLVVDLVVAAMSSGGGVDLLLGGARATTDDRAFDNPFGFRVPAPAPPPPTPPPAPATTAPTTTAPAATTAPPTTRAPVSEVAVAPVGSTRTVCSTSHPVARTACSPGAGVLAGVLALALVLGLAAADHVRSRRAPRGIDR